MTNKVHITYDELFKGSQEFVRHEKRDSVYKIATYLISEAWNDKPNTPSIAEGLGVLLLVWNQAFYRHTSFDFDKLEDFINCNKERLQEFRKRCIFDLNPSDENLIKRLFNELLDVLSVKNKKGRVRKSPVAVAKTLHLIAPSFFPLWDDKIAKGYNCYWNSLDEVCNKYFQFMIKMKGITEKLCKEYAKDNNMDLETAITQICKACSQNMPFNKSLLKIIDEYNYVKYTKHWI